METYVVKYSAYEDPGIVSKKHRPETIVFAVLIWTCMYELTLQRMCTK